MKLLLSLLIGSLALTTAHSATLIEFNFDQQIGENQYGDVSGNGHNVTFNRTTTVNPDYPFLTEYPELSGIDNSARIAHNLTTSGAVSGVTDINLRTTNRFTMEGWVKLEGFANISGTDVGGTIWSISSDVGGTSVFSLRYTATGLLQAQFNSQSQSGGTRTFDTGITLELDEWTHLAYVKHGTNIEVIVNGTSVGSFSESGITSRSMPTGLKGITIGGNFYGLLDDFRLSDTDLSPAELGYQSPFTTIPEPSSVVLLGGAAVIGGLGLARRRIRR